MKIVYGSLLRLVEILLSGIPELFIIFDYRFVESLIDLYINHHSYEYIMWTRERERGGDI